MPDTSQNDPALVLVHEGWDHLKRQRPLAAWASWQRALRIRPEHEAATHALHVLTNAGDLPEAARAEYRFLKPSNDAHRARWDAHFQGRDLAELAVAAGAFGSLADSDPSDTHAQFNEGLCLAWLGRNAEAVASLDKAVRFMADDEPDVAVEAWTMAEVVRQGQGAETLADDRNHIVTMSWSPGEDPAGFLDLDADVRPITNPLDPVTGQPRLPDARVYEWLDRPPVEVPMSAAELPRVRATVVRMPNWLRLSENDPVKLEEAVDEAARHAGRRIAAIRREATPLPLAFLDASIWSFRMPQGLDEEARGRLNRSAVERFYEFVWIQRPREGLDGRSPMEAARLAMEGDPVARVKLTAVVRFREQIGMRSTTSSLYQGYPFDRLRRRLGLPPTDPDSIDSLDAVSMSGPELDQLDPVSLDDYTLADAYESAAALGEDRRTARFARVLANREPAIMAGLDVRALFATLVRREIAEESISGVLAWIDRAKAVDLALTNGREQRTYEIWRAEAFVRLGKGEQALGCYHALVQAFPDPALAIDASETLLDGGFESPARVMAQVALELATAQAHDEAVKQARTLLDFLESEL